MSVQRITIGEQQPSSRWAIFDLDGTLIRTRSGATHPRNADDWCWWNDAVLPALQTAAAEGYALAIVTNQAGQSEMRTARVATVTAALAAALPGVPLLVVAARIHDLYRKPEISTFRDYIWPLVAVPTSGKADLLYVGDAAGRPDDFADSDRKFAYNIHIWLSFEAPTTAKIRFQTPEQYFLAEPAVTPTWAGFDPQACFTAARGLVAPAVPQGEQAVYILVGPPGSGKSRTAATIDDAAVVINQDTLRTKAKCHRAAADALDSGVSIVVDTTSPSRAARLPYLQMAATRRLPCYALVLPQARELAEHLNRMRTRLGGAAVPAVAYNIYYKNYETPSTAEGFAQVIELPFIPRLRTRAEKIAFFQRA